MAAPNIPAAKRAGLPVDVERLTRDGDEWLSPEERYALKTHGSWAQVQPRVFMVRMRSPGGRSSVRPRRERLLAVGRPHGRSWLHLTTRQQLELPLDAAQRVSDCSRGSALPA